jgi:hypothetical protein
MARTSRQKLFAGAAIFLGLAWIGCSRDSEDAPVTAAAPTPVREAKAPTAKLAPVNESLKSGAFDDAAAQLLAMQTSGQNFSPKEALDYRKAMNDAYTRALEAAEKGDQRAIAALQMLRASKPR